MVIDFVIILCIALVAIAFIEWLKKPLPEVSAWVWWAITPVLCIGVALLVDGLMLSSVFKGLVAFAFATLFYDYIIKWGQGKIEELKTRLDDK